MKLTQVKTPSCNFDRESRGIEFCNSSPINLGPGRYKSLNEFGSDTRCFSISPPRAKKPDLTDSRDYNTEKSDRATRVRSPAHAFCEYPYEKQTDLKPKTIKAKKKSNFPQKINYSKPVVR